MLTPLRHKWSEHMTQVSFEEVYASEYIRTSINILVDKTLKNCYNLRLDRNDLHQEVLIAINSATKNYQPERSSIDTFFRAVIKQRLAEIARTAFRKGANKTESSSDIDMIEEPAVCQSAEVNQLSLDIQDALKLLPEDAQAVYRYILNGKSVAQALKLTGVSRYSFYNKYKPMLAEYLQK